MGESLANPPPYKEYFNVEMTTKDQEFFGERLTHRKAKVADMKDPQLIATAIAIFAAVKVSKEQGMTDDQVKTLLEKEGQDLYLNVSSRLRHEASCLQLDTYLRKRARIDAFIATQTVLFDHDGGDDDDVG